MLNGVANGDDYTNRDGRQIRFKSIEIHGQVSMNINQTAPTFLRVMVVIDRDAESLPGIADIIDNFPYYVVLVILIIVIDLLFLKIGL